MPKKKEYLYWKVQLQKSFCSNGYIVGFHSSNEMGLTGFNDNDVIVFQHGLWQRIFAAQYKWQKKSSKRHSTNKLQEVNHFKLNHSKSHAIL